MDVARRLKRGKAIQAALCLVQRVEGHIGTAISPPRVALVLLATFLVTRLDAALPPPPGQHKSRPGDYLYPLAVANFEKSPAFVGVSVGRSLRTSRGVSSCDHSISPIDPIKIHITGSSRHLSVLPLSTYARRAQAFRLTRHHNDDLGRA